MLHKKLTLILFICAIAFTETMAMNLVGKVTAFPDGTKLYLCVAMVPYADDVIVDSCTVSQGTYSLHHNSMSMTVYKVKTDINDRYRYQLLFAALPSDHVSVEGETVKGASGQQQFNQVVLVAGQEMEAGRQNIRLRHKAVLDSMINHRDQVTAIIASPEFKSYQLDMWRYDKAQRNKFRQLMAANASTIFGIILQQQNPLFLPATKAMYDELTPEIKATPYGEGFLTVCKSVVKGAKAPDVQATGLDGRVHSLSSLLHGKKLLLVDFWASWCVPCRKSIPLIKAIYDRYRDLGLAVVSISTDTNEKAWKRATADEQMPWTQLRCDEKVKKAFDVTYIPSVFLIDNQGNILMDHLFGNYLYLELEDAIEHVLHHEAQAS